MSVNRYVLCFPCGIYKLCGVIIFMGVMVTLINQKLSPHWCPVVEVTSKYSIIILLFISVEKF